MTARTRARRYRRRRLTALAVLVAVVVVIVVVITAGGGAQPRHFATPRAASLPSPGFLARVGVLAGSGSGSILGDQATAESDAINRTLAYTPFVRIAGNQHRELALTFDDGPGPYTPQILSILQRMHTPATFFEVGVLEQYFHASTTQIVRDGDPIGDHTETHAPMGELPAAVQHTELLEDATAIGQYGAPFPRLFRPPYGLWNDDTLALLKQYRMLMVLWTVDTNDYTKPGVAAIVHSAESGARPGAIILMHDAGGNRSETVEALPLIIRNLRARGYKLVTVPRLLLDNPAPRDQNVAAFSAAGAG